MDSVIQIQFRMVQCQIDKATGKPTIIKVADLQSGYLSVGPIKLLPLQQGQIKDIYAVSSS